MSLSDVNQIGNHLLRYLIDYPEAKEVGQDDFEIGTVPLFSAGFAGCWSLAMRNQGRYGLSHHSPDFYIYHRDILVKGIISSYADSLIDTLIAEIGGPSSIDKTVIISYDRGIKYYAISYLKDKGLGGVRFVQRMHDGDILVNPDSGEASLFYLKMLETKTGTRLIERVDDLFTFGSASMLSLSNQNV
jgi:hypothetical protein